MAGQNAVIASAAQGGQRWGRGPGRGTVVATRGSRYFATGPVPFDTYQMVCKLEAEGFTRPQAQVVTRVLVDILRASVRLEAEGLVPRVEVDRRLIGLDTRIETVGTELRGEFSNAVMARKESLNRIQNELVSRPRLPLCLLTAVLS